MYQLARGHIPPVDAVYVVLDSPIYRIYRTNICTLHLTTKACFQYTDPVQDTNSGHFREAVSQPRGTIESLTVAVC